MAHPLDRIEDLLDEIVEKTRVLAKLENPGICPNWHEEDSEVCKLMPTGRCYCGANQSLCTYPRRLEDAT